MTEQPCNIVPVAPTTWPFDASYVTAHEMVHPRRGPGGLHAQLGRHGGHVTDDARDILSAGPP